MSATFISAEAVTLSGGSATITIPSDCTAVYVSWTYFNATNDVGLASATLNSANPDPNPGFEIDTSAVDDFTATGMCAWYNPATGARTLAMTFDAATTEGPTIIATYVKNGNTTAVRDVDGGQGLGSNTVNVTLTTVSTDLVIKHDQKFGGTPPTTSASWTSGQTQTNNSESARVSYIVAAGSTQLCECEGEDYSTIVAWSIEENIIEGPAAGRYGPYHVQRALLMR